MSENIIPLRLIKLDPKPYDFPRQPEIQAPPPQKTSLEGSLFPPGKLSDNLDKLYKNLWRSLLEVRLRAMDYKITNPGSQPSESIKVQYNRSPEVRLTEDESLNKLYTLCEQEAYLISKSLLEFIDAAKKSLQVNILHSFTSDGHATLSLEENFKKVIEGGNSTVKGLNI